MANQNKSGIKTPMEEAMEMLSVAEIADLIQEARRLTQHND